MNCRNCGCKIYGEEICPGCGQPTGFKPGAKVNNGIKGVFIAIIIIFFVIPFITTIGSFIAIGSSVNSFFDDVKVSSQYSEDYTSIMDEYKFDNIDWENVLREMLQSDEISSEEDFRDLIEQNRIISN